jgi:hypothetical protein
VGEIAQGGRRPWPILPAVPPAASAGPRRDGLKVKPAASDMTLMNAIAPDTVAILTVAGGGVGAAALVKVPLGPAVGVLARWLAGAVLALAVAAVLTLAVGAGAVAITSAAAGLMLALAGALHVRRVDPRSDIDVLSAPAAQGVRAVVYYTELQAVPVGVAAAGGRLRAPVLIIMPDTGGVGIELCQN